MAYQKLAYYWLQIFGWVEFNDDFEDHFSEGEYPQISRIVSILYSMIFWKKPFTQRSRSVGGISSESEKSRETYQKSKFFFSEWKGGQSTDKLTTQWWMITNKPEFWRKIEALFETLANTPKLNDLIHMNSYNSHHICWQFMIIIYWNK